MSFSDVLHSILLSAVLPWLLGRLGTSTTSGCIFMEIPVSRSVRAISDSPILSIFLLDQDNFPLVPLFSLLSLAPLDREDLTNDEIEEVHLDNGLANSG